MELVKKSGRRKQPGKVWGENCSFPEMSLTLSSAVLAGAILTLPVQEAGCGVKYGASGRIRTSDRSVRSRVLYPAELRMQMAVRRGFEPRMQLLTAYSLSRGAPSASRPPHHTHSCELCFRTLFLLIGTAWRTYYFLGLISQTYFSPHAFVCTIHSQYGYFGDKKSDLSTIITSLSGNKVTRENMKSAGKQAKREQEKGKPVAPRQ